jgi:MoaA/NifB/PqqE/SkfB family radical SAM enzyme
MPTWMTIGVTFRCQCRCVHCYAFGRFEETRGELTTAQVKALLDEARSLGTLQVAFSGGEPLLREDIVELVAHAHGLGLLTRLRTNGSLLTRDTALRLREAGLTMCGVSVDDAEAAVHDRLRGLAGLHATAIQGMDNLAAAGILCEILTYASKRNVPDGLKKIVALGREHGVASVFVFFPAAAGRWNDAADQLLSDEEKNQVWALQDLGCVHVELPGPQLTCCVFEKSLLYVSAYGDVTPCPFVPYAMGHVQEHTLSEIWQRFCEEPMAAHRGDCVLNDTHGREQLRRHLGAIEGDLR